MKTKLIAALFMFTSLNSFAQSGKSTLTDDLLKDKQTLLPNYIPMANGIPPPSRPKY